MDSLAKSAVRLTGAALLCGLFNGAAQADSQHQHQHQHSPSAASAQSASAMSDHMHGSHTQPQVQPPVLPRSAVDHQAMDHGAISHGSMHPDAMPHDLSSQQSTPAQTIDHSQMDHRHMDHSHMQHGAQSTSSAQSQSRTPIAKLTDADRAAAFPDVHGHPAHDSAINHFLLIDQLEYQNADAGSTLAWDVAGWLGGDINRLWLRSEGARTAGVTHDAELQLLYGRAIGPWWEAVAGVRQDFKPGSPQTWAAFGVQGMPLYGLEVQATAFLGEAGQSGLRFEGEYDILLTNKLILQPRAELNLYSRNDSARERGAGISNSELGLRLRYEITRQFAPYIGVNWSHAYGNSADYLRAEGSDPHEARFVAGVRMWF